MPERPRLTPAMADVRRAVRECWDTQGVEPGELVLVACSGGADSLALAAAAAFEGKRAGVRVGAAIVEHGLQQETAAVAQRTAAVLRGLGLDPVQVLPVRVDLASGTGVEAAARVARYAALEQAVQVSGARFVLLGHTLNDQAETVLLGLTRGSGARSLAGMADRNGIYMRPLLGLTRATTEAFCVDSGLEFWQDPHNVDLGYTRVRIRQQVLPVLEEQLGPGVAQALARTADTLREDADLLDSLAQQQFELLAAVRATDVVLDCSLLQPLAAALRHRCYQLALQVLAAPSSRAQLTAIDALVTNFHGQQALALAGVRVERTNGQLAFKLTKNLRPGAC